MTREPKYRSVAVLTSGGDAPGMNAAIRSVVRCATAQGMEAFGVRDGYSGLVEGHIEPLGARDVGGILQVGGTFLGSARCKAFRDPEVRRRAIQNLRDRSIESLVVIGGNGSQTGANALAESGFPVVGIASTIDNDLLGCDISLGVDTAVNIALDAIDKLKVTASSHRRASAVELMGRDCGYLALVAGIAGGAECILVPEAKVEVDEVIRIMNASLERGKSHALIVIAEGAEYDLDRLTEIVRARGELDADFRATRLGHVQRGGTPSAFDRMLAARCGQGAIHALSRGESGVLVGMMRSEIVTTPLAEVAGKTKGVDPELIELARILAR